MDMIEKNRTMNLIFLVFNILFGYCNCQNFTTESTTMDNNKNIETSDGYFVTAEYSKSQGNTSKLTTAVDDSSLTHLRLNNYSNSMNYDIHHSNTLARKWNLSDTKNRCGTPVSVVEYPYVASVWRIFYTSITEVKMIPMCTGMLISPQHVLISSFCFTYAMISNIDIQKDSLKVRLRSSFQNMRGDIYSVIKISTNLEGKITYDKNLGDGLGYGVNFVTILHIRHSSQMITNKDAVKLPMVKEFLNIEDMVSKEARCYTLGWGTTHNYAVKLKRTELKLMSWNKCKSQHKSPYPDMLYSVAGWRYIRTIKKYHICAEVANDDDKDKCCGDISGPLICNEKLFGVSEWIFGCGKKDITPFVFTRIDQIMKFIKQEFANVAEDTIMTGENVREIEQCPSRSTKLLSQLTVFIVLCTMIYSY